MQFLATWWWAILLGFLLSLTLYDIIQRQHAIRRIFPLVGRIRYFLEMIGPEMRQYWVANDKEEAPFNRDERRWVYSSSKGQNKNFGFGTTELLYRTGYPLIKHAVFPFPETILLSLFRGTIFFPFPAGLRQYNHPLF